MTKSMYYSNRPVMGNNSLFNIFVGGRGIGKTFSSQNYVLRKVLKKGEKFIWFRLTESSAKKLLERNGADFIDSLLIEKWKIKSVQVKDNVIYINNREACRVMALSTFYSTKGVAMNKQGKREVRDIKLSNSQMKRKISDTIKKYKYIVLDEMNREKNEKKTFDISYAFVNQLENICRLDTDRRIILMGNTLEEASDILASCFNFIPNKFGIYKLKKKRAIIHYIEDSDKFKEKRSDSIAGILMPNESTFTNMIKSDIELLYNNKVIPKPTAIIRFTNTKYFTLCGNVITQHKQPANNKLPVFAMQPYLTGIPYFKEHAKKVIDAAQQRQFKFDQLLTLKLFYKELKQIKGAQ